MLGLRARHLGKFGRHPPVGGFFAPHLVDLDPNLRLASGEGLLILEAPRDRVLELLCSGVVDAFRPLVASTLVKSETVCEPLRIDLERDFRVDDLVEELGVALRIDYRARLIRELNI